MKIQEKSIFNQYLEVGGRLQPQILLTLISIFSQNIDEFQKQVQTLESVHPLISKYTKNTYFVFELLLK